VIGDELYDYPAVSDAWSDARSDTDLTLGFMRKGDTPAEVWEAKAEFERLGSEIHEAQRSFRSGALDAWQLSRLSELHQRVSEFFGGLTSEARQHPVLRHAMSRSKYNLLTVSSTPLPTLSPEERAELKFRRIYRWTEDLRSVLFLAEISPPSEAAEDDWLENELTTERRVKEVVEARGGHLVSLYWVFEEEHAALLLTYGVEYEEDAADVTEGLVAFGLF
jgi:hypothetical protein